MRRIIILAISLLMGLTMKAQPGQGKQPEHFEFDGVPMDRTIVQFKINMSVRGYSIDKEASNEQEDMIAFQGTYSGYHVWVYTFYAPGTKHVYEAQAEFPYTSRQMAESQWQWFKDQFERKIVSANLGYSQTNGVGVGPGGRVYYMMVNRQPKPRFADGPATLGTVYMYVDKMSSSSPYYTDEDHAYNLVMGFIDTIHDAEKSGR